MRTPMPKLVRAFWRHRSGVAAIEFGMIAPIFFALVLSTFDAGWLMTQSMLLDRAMDKSIRLVRIGGDAAPKTHAALKSSICDEATLIRDCAARLIVEMTVIKTASNFPTTSAPCVSRSATPNSTFQSGGRSEVVYVRACLAVDPLVPIIGEGLGLPRAASGYFNIISVTGFMNEPGV
jgi:Flp pilus assembly protein TadG